MTIEATSCHSKIADREDTNLPDGKFKQYQFHSNGELDKINLEIKD